MNSQRWLRRNHSVQFSCSVMSDSLLPHVLQHARLPCPAPTPKAYSDSCPLSWWYHWTISSSVSVITFSSCLQSFPASGSFPVSWLFTSDGQSIGASAKLYCSSFHHNVWTFWLPHTHTNTWCWLSVLILAIWVCSLSECVVVFHCGFPLHFCDDK